MLPDFWTRQNLLWGLTPVTPTERLLLLSLNFHAGDSGEAWPSQATLSEKIGVSDRQIRNLTQHLQDGGWITIRRASPNRYRLNWDAISSSVPKLKPETDFRIESGNTVPVAGDRNRKSATPNRKLSSGETGSGVPTNTQEHKQEHQKRDGGSDSQNGTDLESMAPEFDTAEVRHAIDRWRQHRKELRKKLTPSTEQALFRELLDIGPARFVNAVSHSIKQGWQGLYEPKTNGRWQPNDTSAEAGQAIMAEHTRDVLEKAANQKPDDPEARALTAKALEAQREERLAVQGAHS